MSEAEILKEKEYEANVCTVMSMQVQHPPFLWKTPHSTEMSGNRPSFLWKNPFFHEKVRKSPKFFQIFQISLEITEKVRKSTEIFKNVFFAILMFFYYIINNTVEFLLHSIL